MNDQQLEHLLHEAGRDAPSAELPADLAARVARSLRHRRRIRTGARFTALGLIVLVGAGLALDRYYPARSTPAVPEVAVVEPAARPAKGEDLQAELARLRAEVKQLRTMIRDMGRRERLRTRLAGYRKQLSQLDPLELAQIEFEKTAFVMVDQAAKSGSPAAAYRRTIELFPNTSWAQVARDRLSQTEKKEGAP